MNNPKRKTRTPFTDEIVTSCGSAEVFLGKYLVWLVPGFSDVPRYGRILLAFFWIFGCMAIFFYFFASGYVLKISEEYLAPLESTNQYDASSDCSLIPLSANGNFLATIDGYWQGSVQFKQPFAAFTLSASNINLNLKSYGIDVQTGIETYELLMEKLYTNLKSHMNESLQQDLTYNMLIWMTNVITLKELLHLHQNPPIRFSLNGDALVVFNRNVNLAGIADSNSFCQLKSSVSFISYDGIFSVTYNNQSQVNANQACARLIGISSSTKDSTLLNQAKSKKISTVAIDFDIRSLVTAISVNLGINDLDDLVQISDQNYTIMGYTFNKYYNSKYTGMHGVICTVNINFANPNIPVPFCLLPVGNLLGLPILNHVGLNNQTNTPIPCICSKLTSAQKNNANSSCNQFQFIHGVIYYTNEQISSQNNLVIKLAQSYISLYGSAPGYAMQILNKDAYHASFMLSFATMMPRKSYFSFCQNNCKIFAISSFDLDYSDFHSDSIINTDYYSLPTGACSASYVPTEEAWKRLSKTPFTPLFEPYQKCSNPLTNVVIENLGIGMGNVSLFSLPLFIILLFLVLLCYKICGVPLEGEYSRLERQQTIDALAQLLLLTRDKKINITGEEAGVIDQIINKLKEHHDEIDVHVNPEKQSMSRRESGASEISRDSGASGKGRSSSLINIMNPIRKSKSSDQVGVELALSKGNEKL